MCRCSWLTGAFLSWGRNAFTWCVFRLRRRLTVMMTKTQCGSTGFQCPLSLGTSGSKQNPGLHPPVESAWKRRVLCVNRAKKLSGLSVWTSHNKVLRVNVQYSLSLASSNDVDKKGTPPHQWTISWRRLQGNLPAPAHLTVVAWQHGCDVTGQQPDPVLKLCERCQAVDPASELHFRGWRRGHVQLCEGKWAVSCRNVLSVQLHCVL